MFIIFISFVLIGNYCAPYTLRDEISYYEILHTTHVTHNVARRSVTEPDKEDTAIRHLIFTTHGREFTLKLRQNSAVLSDDFSAHYFDKQNSHVKDFALNREALYTGYVSGDYSSDAIVYMSGDGNDDVITATIFTYNDTVHIEPLRKLVVGAPHSEMIVYKESNLKERPYDFLETNIDGHIAAVMTPDSENLRHTPSKIRSRRSAQKPPANSCSVPFILCRMYLVADYTFFREVGNSDRRDTIYHMLQAIQLADKTFKGTQWDQGVGCNIGLTVTEVHVLEQPSSVDDPT
jgi:Reprolysin family propeptide.